MASEAVEEYKTTLADLKFNSKPHINMLTMLAEESQAYAAEIVRVIEDHIRQTSVPTLLPTMYLIDSIIKNIKKGPYKKIFELNIDKTFGTVFEKVDEKTRQALYKLRNTWNDIFDNDRLYSLDQKAKRCDPAWPVTAKPPEPKNIHVNPKFLKKTDSTAAAAPPAAPVASEAELLAEQQAQLLKKQRELLKLQEQQMELELLEASQKLQKQQERIKALAAEREKKEKSAPAPQEVLKDPRLARMAKRDSSAALKQLGEASPRSTETRVTKSDSDTKNSPSIDVDSPPQIIPPKSKSSKDKHSTKRAHDNHSDNKSGDSRSNDQRNRKDDYHRDSRQDRNRDRRDKDRGKRDRGFKSHQSQSRNYRRKKGGGSSDEEERRSRPRESSRDREKSRSPRSVHNELEERRNRTNPSKRGLTPPGQSVKQDNNRVDARKDSEEPEVKKAKSDDQESDETKPLPPDLAELFGKADTDYRKLPPIPKRAPGSQSPPISSAPGPLQSPQVGWSRHKASHPENFPFQQPRSGIDIPSSPMDVDLRRLDQRRMSQTSPEDMKSKMLLDQAGNVVEQADAQLASGKITEEQHSEIISKLNELQTLQKIKQSLRTSPQITSKVQQGNQMPPPMAPSRDSRRGTQGDNRPVFKGSNNGQFQLPYDSEKHYILAHDPRWYVVQKDSESHQVAIDHTIHDLPYDGTSMSICIGPHTVSVVADPTCKEIRIDGNCHYRIGDELRRFTYRGRDHSIVFCGPPKKVWIDGVLHEVMTDAPARLIQVDNHDYEIKLDSISNSMIINNHFVCTMKHAPQIVHFGNQEHEVSFMKQPQQILIDGKLCELDFTHPIPCVRINGIRHGIRFDGPPREIFINGVKWSVSVDRPRRARFSGNVPSILALGGPGHELIVDGIWHELKFNGEERQIVVGRRLHTVSFRGPPPEVKILGEVIDDAKRIADLEGGHRIDLSSAIDKQHRYNVQQEMLHPHPRLRPLYSNPRAMDPRGGPPRGLLEHPRLRPRQPVPDDQMGDIDERRLHPMVQPGASRDPRMGPMDPRKPMLRPREGVPGEYARPIGPYAPRGLHPTRMRQPLGMRHPGSQPPTVGVQDAMVIGSTLGMMMGMRHSMMSQPLPSNRMPHSNMMQQPNVRPASATGQVNVNDLFSKLVSSGILKKVDDEKSSTSTQESQPISIGGLPLPLAKVLAKEKSSKVLKDVKTEEIPDMTDLKLDKFKVRHDGVLQKLMTGTQCTSCGQRFQPDNMARYSEHLDWHFRQNKREKEDTKVTQFRRWYYSTADWITFEESGDPSDEPGQSSYFEKVIEANNNPLGGGKVSDEIVSCPAASGDENDDFCEICREPFEQFWDEDEEEWQLKDAIRVNGRTYHPVCYEDAKENSMLDVSILDTTTPTENPDELSLEAMDTAEKSSSLSETPASEQQPSELARDGSIKEEMVVDEVKEESGIDEKENTSPTTKSEETEVSLKDSVQTCHATEES